MNLTLSKTNKLIQNNLNNTNKNLLELSFNYAKNGNNNPGTLFYDLQAIRSKIDTGRLLYAIGLTPNQSKSEAVQLFIQSLSGTSVSTVV